MPKNKFTIVCPKCKETIEVRNLNITEKILTFIFKKLNEKITLKVWHWIIITFIVYILYGILTRVII